MRLRAEAVLPRSKQRQRPRLLQQHPRKGLHLYVQLDVYVKEQGMPKRIRQPLPCHPWPQITLPLSQMAPLNVGTRVHHSANKQMDLSQQSVGLVVLR